MLAILYDEHVVYLLYYEAIKGEHQGGESKIGIGWVASLQRSSLQKHPFAVTQSFFCDLHSVFLSSALHTRITWSVECTGKIQTTTL